MSVTSDGLILYAKRKVMPKKLQNEVINIAHQIYQGREKPKHLLNQFVWLTQLSAKVDKFVESCHVCNSNSEKKSFQPLIMSLLPNNAWEQLGTDFHCPLASGEYLMVIIGEFSSFPIVKLLKSLNANNVIKIWRKVFRLFSYPKEVKTDNGPPFQSCLVRQFMFENNNKHRKITPLWPRKMQFVKDS